MLYWCTHFLLSYHSHQLRNIGSMDWFNFLWHTLPPDFDLFPYKEVISILSLQSSFTHCPRLFLYSWLPAFLSFMDIHYCLVPWCIIPEPLGLFIATFHYRRVFLDLLPPSVFLITWLCVTHLCLALIFTMVVGRFSHHNYSSCLQIYNNLWFHPYPFLTKGGRE